MVLVVIALIIGLAITILSLPYFITLTGKGSQ
jgi:hypothetical protein